MGTATARTYGLFGDDVFTAADLNRRSSEILNRAKEKPVTINRNSEQFALLRRDQAAELVKAKDQFGPIIELVSGAISTLEGKEPSASHFWLKAFDVDDLRKMVREVLVECAAALNGTGEWEVVEDIIHQWHESATVVMNPEMKEAMQSQDEDLELPNPRVADEEAEYASASGI